MFEKILLILTNIEDLKAPNLDRYYDNELKPYLLRKTNR